MSCNQTEKVFTRQMHPKNKVLRSMLRPLNCLFHFDYKKRVIIDILRLIWAWKLTNIPPFLFGTSNKTIHSFGQLVILLRMLLGHGGKNKSPAQVICTLEKVVRIWSGCMSDNNTSSESTANRILNVIWRKSREPVIITRLEADVAQPKNESLHFGCLTKVNANSDLFSQRIGAPFQSIQKDYDD